MVLDVLYYLQIFTRQFHHHMRWSSKLTRCSMNEIRGIPAATQRANQRQHILIRHFLDWLP